MGSRLAGRRRWAGIAAAAAGLVWASAGCPRTPGGPVKLEPTQVPPTFIAVAPGQTLKSAQHLTGSTLYLRVKDATTGLRVPRAAIGIRGPTLAAGTSGATYDLTFGPMGAGTYRVRVAAPGYITREQDLTISARPNRGQKTPDTQLEIALQPGGGVITGTVVDPGGRPIAGAWIRAGLEHACSGPDGTFRIEGLGPGPHTVEVRKTGYTSVSAPGVAPGADVGRVTLGPSGLVVNIANATAVFGTQAAGTVLGGLIEALRAAGATVKENDPAGAHVQVLAAPGRDVEARASDLLSWTEGGGKLVVLGEWAGLSGYSPEAADALLQPAGLAMEADLVRSGRNAGQPDWPLAQPVPPWPWKESEVGLFQASSVFAVPPAQAVLRASGGFRIAAVAKGDPVLAAIAPYGSGLIAAAGDTSAWTDSNTTGNGPDLGYKDNRSYVVNLILW